MGFLGDFRELFVGAINYVAGGIRDVITESLDIVTEGVINIATDIRETFKFERIYKRRMTEKDKQYIRRELRKQYLALIPGEREEIDGVEFEGEIYTETPH